MLRTALRPRWLGLFALLLVVMALFLLLGLWQLNVARDKGRAEAVRLAPSRPVAALTTVITPNAQFPADGSGRRVTATGHYDPSGQVLITPRVLDGARGSWVVTPLVLDTTKARIAVVRGFVRGDAAAPPPAASASVTVAGTLAPGESPADGSAAPLPAGRMAALDLSVLVNRWPGEVYNAFMFATAETPDVTARASSAGAGPALLRVPPPAIPVGGLAWRNAAYALQWWIFALFAAYMWWRMVRDDYEREQAQPAPARDREVTDV